MRPRPTVDQRRRLAASRIVWIHSDHNAEFCHYFADAPDDLPNFYVEACTSDGPVQMLDELKTDDDLA